MAQVRKARLIIEPDESGGSRVVIDHFAPKSISHDDEIVDAGYEGEPDHSRMFYMARGEVMNFRVQDGMIVFEKHVSPNSSDLAGNFVTGLLSGLSGVIK